MKEIYLYPISRRVRVPDKAHQLLCIYKIWWPPETTVKLGKNKIVKLEDLTPWPPPEQEKML